MTGTPPDSAADVVVVGLGRVGLPQALLLADAGWKVCGVDVDQATVSCVGSGQSPFLEPGMQELLERVLQRGQFSVAHASALDGLIPRASYVIVSVGTPFDDSRMRVQQDGFFALMRQLLGLLPPRDATIILRPSLPVGTTDHVREIAYKQLGLVEGEDYHLLYVPERLAEGKAVQEEMTLPKLIGAYSTQGFQKGVDLLTRIGSDIIRLSSPAAAEFAKLVDNAYRNTMFAFANELARAAEEERLDAWEIIEACNARYPRNSIPRPGPVSGYCLGKDPYLLGRSLKEREDGALVPDYLWMQARQDNERLFERVASEIAADVRAQSLRDPHVLVLGLAFKEGVDDFRMSHAFSIIRALRAKILDLTLTLYDPAVNSNRYTQIPEDIAPLAQKVTSRLDDALATSADVAVIATPDACLRQLSGPAQLVNSAGAQAPKPALVYDCWNLWRGAPSTTAVTYRALGVGPQEVQGQQ